ncbi:hypothetical protein C5L39_01255 [Corynebacterium alimapuense]|uniref:Uncharacterized protein n=1 Tax=Corynebacterium alimapuense TaxID=1576874 RepID=A0A3M8KB56_9CORY|nr:hypothetical protein C5L39_01255 [Corynebacterium alimapuense]
MIWSGTVVSLLLCLALPIIAWFPPGGFTGAALAILCVLWAGGTGLAALLVGQSRILWLVLSPVLSLAALIIPSLLQAVMSLWHPPSTATIVALIGGASSMWWLSKHPRPAFKTPRIPRRGAVFRILSILIALALWWWATRIIDLDSAGALGLLGVLPLPFYLAVSVIVTMVSFLLLRRGSSLDAQDRLVLSLSAALTAVMITVLVNVSDGGATMATGYVHVGFADAISRDGSLMQSMDARFSWAGFFSAAAAATAWSGAPSLAPFLVIYPALISCLYLPSIYLIGVSLTGDQRVGWLSLFAFLSVNWSQQEYFSPQSVAMLFYLSIIAVLAHEIATTPELGTHGQAWPWWRIDRRLLTMMRTTPARPTGWTAGMFIKAELAILIIALAMVVSHQLTPVALILVLLGASVLGVTRHRTLWIGMGLAFSLWFVFGATDWWTGHLSELISGFGQVSQALSSGVGDRVQGDPLRQIMQTYRIAWTGVASLIAFFVWWKLSSRMKALSTILITAPALLVVGQSYGGEIALRVLLYTSAAIAPLFAWAIIRFADWAQTRRAPHADDSPAAQTMLIPIATAALLMFSLLAGVTARGVNVAFERTPADIVTAAEEILTIAPQGTTARPLATEGALRMARVGELSHPATVAGDDDPFLRLRLQSPDYVFLTSTREAYEHLVNQAPEDWYAEIAERLEATGDYRIIHQSEHVISLERINSRGLPLSEDPGVGAPAAAEEEIEETP